MKSHNGLFVLFIRMPYCPLTLYESNFLATPRLTSKIVWSQTERHKYVDIWQL